MSRCYIWNGIGYPVWKVDSKLRVTIFCLFFFSHPCFHFRLLVFANVNMEIEKNPERGMSYLQQFSCGVGHVINDVTRRLLQSFRMIFLMRVVGISATYAGLFTLYGFFAGALLFAPMAGFLCDKVKIPVLSRRLGKKKSWHLFGTIAATIGVPLLFSQCLVCGSGTSEWVVLLYYFSIATVISFSINFVDISHLSIILVLAKDQSEAAKLTALRFVKLFRSLHLYTHIHVGTCWLYSNWKSQ